MIHFSIQCMKIKVYVETPSAPKDIDKLLTPRALAYWFIDDGTYHTNKSVIRNYVLRATPAAPEGQYQKARGRASGDEVTQFLFGDHFIRSTDACLVRRSRTNLWSIGLYCVFVLRRFDLTNTAISLL